MRNRCPVRTPAPSRSAWRVARAVALPVQLVALVLPCAGAEDAASERLPWQTTMSSGVSFRTADADLQNVFDAAEKKLAGNIVPLSPGIQVLTEGGGYPPGAWLESQPMGGEMYAKRDPQIALNNQMVFLLAQRADGRMPAKLIPAEGAAAAKWLFARLRDVPEAVRSMPEYAMVAHYAVLQGYCFPHPAWKTYFWTGKNRDYLQRLYRALEAHDAYLWRTRDSNGDGVLETWCVWDTGEDKGSRLLTRGAPSMWPFDQPPLAPGMPDPQDPESVKRFWIERGLKKLPPPKLAEVRVPLASMDVMGYSYDGRTTLAKIARELGNGREDYWRREAEEVRRRIIKSLWVPARQACFDRDREGHILPELIHNNLRVMQHGAYTQEMADQFIRQHLLNPAEFWTPIPLPSIAANESLYANEPGNSWSGQPQGLTYQRAIRALENYGHYAELSLLGTKYLEVLARNGCVFAQQMDAFTGEPSGLAADGYGPTMLAALEYMAHLHGVNLVLDEDAVWWSSLRPTGHAFRYTQRWGEQTFTLIGQADRMRGEVNGREVFSCSGGVRIVTDLEGKLREVVGIHPEPQSIVVCAEGARWELTVAPNQVFGWQGGQPRLLGATPFDFPFGSCSREERSSLRKGPCHILLRSSWQAVNIGDIGHTPGVLRLLERHFPEAKVTLWPADSDAKVHEMLAAAFPKVAIVRGSLSADGKPSTRALATALAEADFLLHGSGPSVVARRDVAGWWRLTGKPYGIYGVTIDPISALEGVTTEGDTIANLTTAVGRLPCDHLAPDLRAILERARFVFCRDTLSLRYLRSQHLAGPHVDFAPDGAFGMELRNDRLGELYLREHDLTAGKFICVIPRLRYTPYHLIRRQTPTQRDKDRAAISARHAEEDLGKLREMIVRWVRETGGKVLVCPEMTYQIDTGREFLVDRLPADVKPHVVLRDRFWLPDEACSVYAQAEAVVSLDNHSPIFALAMGTPAMYVRQPTDTIKGQMWNDVGVGDWFREIGQVSGQSLCEDLLAIHRNPEAARARARKIMEGVRRTQAATMGVVKAEVTAPRPSAALDSVLRSDMSHVLPAVRAVPTSEPARTVRGT